MVSPKFVFVLTLFFSIGFVESNSRVCFSRPGDMIRIPSVDHSALEKLFTINLSYEFLSSEQGNSNLSINAFSKSGYQYGMSLLRPTNTTDSFELGFHFQTNAIVYGNINIDFGVHDIVFK